MIEKEIVSQKGVSKGTSKRVKRSHFSLLKRHAILELRKYK